MQTYQHANDWEHFNLSHTETIQCRKLKLSVKKLKLSGES